MGKFRTHIKRLAGVLAVATYGSVVPIVVCAQEHPRAQAFQLDIRAGALSAVLTQFSEATGVQLVYSSELVKGLRSVGVSGELTIANALARILDGSGLEPRFMSEKTIALVASSVKGARTLGPVRVEGADSAAVNGINGSRDVTATEGTGSFTTGAMTIGSKSPRSIKDTPQSVSVLTHEKLEQQNINDFTRALRQAPGVSLAQGSTSLETTFYSRGFEITSIQVDGGAPLATGSGFFPQIDLSQYDHVEVLRGAAGLFNGYGDPSGTINLVRKKPLDHEQIVFDSEWGSWNHNRAMLDATAPLAFAGRLRGRMVLTWQSNDQFYEVAEDRRTMLFGVLDYDLTASTLVTAGLSQTNQDSTPWYGGLPSYQTGEDLGLSRKTGLLFPWNRWDFDTTEIFASIAQQIGEDWMAKLNLTQNEQSSTRKVGYSFGAVNPVDNRGPTLAGEYTDYSNTQLSTEATLAGAFTLFGQRQEVTLGVNHTEIDDSDVITYSSLITSSPTAPYRPYPGGPLYCTNTSVCPVGLATPAIDVFAFNPFDVLYTEPANPLPRSRVHNLGQAKSLAYLNLRLTAFDRLHLEAGARWSRYEYAVETNQLCTSIPTSGTPGATNCVGRRIGDAYGPSQKEFSGKELSWPPSTAISYDVTNNLIAYLGYTDIYIDQSDLLNGDLQPIGPVTGGNVELGFKSSTRNGRLNTALSLYRIEKHGFQQQEPNILARAKRNPDGSLALNDNNQVIIIANDGTELANGQPDAQHYCCYIQRTDRTQLSEGVDAEVTGEVLKGWQVSASYTFSRNEYDGSGYTAAEQGHSFLTIQPEHLYKLWTTYDLGAAGLTGWLSNLTFSGGVNGQSRGYRAGQTCPEDQVGQPNPVTGIAPCRVSLLPYEFTVDPYAVVSGRIDYRLNESWSAALNVENIFDETYYQSVGDVSRGNWYGAPRSFVLSVRGSF